MVLKLANPEGFMNVEHGVYMEGVLHLDRSKSGKKEEQRYVARMLKGDYVSGHDDGEDGMCQLLATYGTFTGGLLWVQNAKGKVSTIDTQHCPTIVDGRLRHGVLPVTSGKRWVMIIHGSKHLNNFRIHKKGFEAAEAKNQVVQLADGAFPEYIN